MLHFHYHFSPKASTFDSFSSISHTHLHRHDSTHHHQQKKFSSLKIQTPAGHYHCCSPAFVSHRCCPLFYPPSQNLRFPLSKIIFKLKSTSSGHSISLPSHTTPRNLSDVSISVQYCPSKSHLSSNYPICIMGILPKPLNCTINVKIPLSFRCW